MVTIFVFNENNKYKWCNKGIIDDIVSFLIKRSQLLSQILYNMIMLHQSLASMLCLSLSRVVPLWIEQELLAVCKEATFQRSRLGQTELNELDNGQPDILSVLSVQKSFLSAVEGRMWREEKRRGHLYTSGYHISPIESSEISHWLTAGWQVG